MSEFILFLLTYIWLIVISLKMFSIEKRIIEVKEKEKTKKEKDNQ